MLWFASGRCFSTSLQGETMTEFLFPSEIKSAITNFICAADDTGYFLQTANKETWYATDLTHWKKLSPPFGCILYVDKTKVWVQNVEDSPQKQAVFELKSILTPEDWAKFQERVELVYPQFQQRLRERYPQLTTSEIRVLLLAKIGIKSIVESANILGISQESVKKTRFRLRKKINMPETPLEDILAGI